MPNFLFNRYGNNNVNRPIYNNGNNGNILNQFMQCKNNPGAILDILLQKGKITQQQYTDLQQYKNNPEAIGRYLINAVNGQAINGAQKVVSNN